MVVDDDEDVRSYAAEALGRLGPVEQEAVTALTEALKNDDEDVREFAAKALMKIQGDRLSN